MDLTLNKTPMEGYTCLLDTILYQEETQESIVPDASPDIQAIIATDAQVCLSRKECGDGKAEAAGFVRVSVLYLPEGETGVRRLAITVPFRCAANASALTAGALLTAAPHVTGTDTRLLNPRKVLVRVELSVALQAWTMTEETLCGPWEEPEYGIQQRVEETEDHVVMGVAEKSFSFSDEVTISGGRPAAESILSHRLDIRRGETKMIGNKLVIKGDVILLVHYRTAEGNFAGNRWELPFSQITELNGVDEECACDVDIVERGSEVTLSPDGDGRLLTVRLELLAQGVVRETRNVTLFTDAYSVTHDVSLEKKDLTLTRLREENTSQETARATAETSTPVSQVEDCCVRLGKPQVEREAGAGTLTVRGEAVCCYTGVDGVLAAITVPLIAQCRVDLPEGGNCKVKCAVSGEPQAVPAGAGVEVRVPVTFQYRITTDETYAAVAALSVEERKEGESRPSVILRLAQPGEKLWDIAKTYCTTERDIKAANDLADEAALSGRMLLIPRSR